MTHKDVIELVNNLLQPVLNGLNLWDVELVKEGKNLFLRVYIDKKGGVNIEDCERISKHISQTLDEIDPIKDPYILEVSSPGINRSLKKESDYLQFIGHIVDVKLYKPINKNKIFQGVLSNYENGIITIKDDESTHSFQKTDIASCRLSVIL